MEITDIRDWVVRGVAVYHGQPEVSFPIEVGGHVNAIRCQHGVTYLGYTLGVTCGDIITVTVNPVRPREEEIPDGGSA